MKQGWTYKQLGDVCEILDSKRKPITKGKREPGSIPYYGATGCLDYVKDYIFDEKLVLLGEDGAKWGPGESSAYIISGKSWVNNHAHALRPKREIILDEILVYYLNYSNLQTFITGVTVPKLNQEKMRSIEVPVAPISEQERIVERLDAAFAQIDELKSNAEKQLAEARALFQSALTQAMQPKPGWQKTTIGDICEIERGKRFVRADIVDDGVPCIHYGDIYTYYGLSVTKTKGCIKPELAKKMRFAKKNDVVVVQAGENNWDIGVGVAYFGEEPAAVHDACFILRHKQDPMFISYYLRSYNYHWYLLDYVHEGKICSFLKPALEKAPIPLPPLSEQQSIVATLDSLKSKVDRLQENFITMSQECDALKQAILRQIFE